MKERERRMPQGEDLAARVAFARRCYELARERADELWHKAAQGPAGPEAYAKAHREMLERHREWRVFRDAARKGGAQARSGGAELPR